MKATFYLLAFLFVFSSCKKEGCTDVYATNYNEVVDVDDGSCLYVGTAHFWMNFSTSQNLIATPSLINDILFYLDGDRVGALSHQAYSSVPPVCGDEGITFTVDLGTKLNDIVHYDIRYVDASGSETIFQQGTLDISANNCAQTEVVF